MIAHPSTPSGTHPAPAIIDIEASGLGHGSYPIEIGLALNSGQRYCSLIQPARDWVHWDAGAESLHGISRALLASRGRSARRVALELNDLLAGQIVYSDGWVVDYPWLIRLYEAAGLQPLFQFFDLQTILSEAQMAIWHATKAEVSRELNLARHRASNDALIVQHTFVRSGQRLRAARADAQRN